MTTTPTQPATTLQPGDKLDKYEVRDTIGAGGMAVVFKGYDALLDRFVAIKQINMEQAAANGDDGALERFRREARLQKRAAPNHKHLVSFIDFIEEPRGLFIIQEFVDGVSLEQILTTKPNPMDQRQALGIIGATTLALQAIHHKSIIHRDLKPSNILLPHEGGLKVCDFGLAASIAEQESLPLGSVRYMAPELFQGGAVDGRADIYALGMISYEMLLGRAAFNEAFKIVLRDQRNQALRWMKWHTNLRVRPVPLNQLNRTISDTLSDLVARMLDKDPQSRIQSAEELLDTIRRHFTPGGSPDKKIVDDTREVAAAPRIAAPAEVTAKLATGSKLPYILVALLIVNVLAGLGLWAWYAQDKASKREALRQTVATQLDEGHRLYRSGEFAGALAIFESVHGDWAADAEFGKVSQAGMLMSQAMLDLQAKRYLEAVQKLDQADELGVVRNRDRIADLRRQAIEDDAFEKEVARIEGLIAEGRYPEARFALQQQFNRNHPEPKATVVQQLAGKISQSVNEADIDAYMDRAQRQLEASRRDKAMEILTEGSSKYPGSKLERLLNNLRGEAEFEVAIAEATAAEARNELGVAIEAYKRAQSRRSDDAESDARLEERIRILRTDLALQRARGFFSARDMTSAEASLREVLVLDPDNKEAQGMLAQIATADEKESIVRAAENAMASRDYATAIKLFGDALRFGPDARITEQLVNARLRQYLERGMIALSQKKLAEARAAFDEAAQLSSNDPEVLSAQAQLTAWSDFQKLVDEGDAGLSGGRFGEAIDRYRKALKYGREHSLPQAALDEVQQRVDTTEYQSLLSQARFEVEAKRWGAARGILRTLMGMPNGNTPEVQALMVEVNRNDPGVN